MNVVGVFRIFLRSESGAVTVDWVVLTAAVVGVVVAALSLISTGVEDLSSDLSYQLRDQQISTDFE